MKLTIYNGSPRGKSGNSEVIAGMLIQNLSDNADIQKYYLKNTDNHNEMLDGSADTCFFVFPLYADAMPYAVKAFFEVMEENKDKFSGKKFYFFIHSGFPEAKQSRLLERYLKYFCILMNVECMGVCVMGSSEMLRNMQSDSKRMTKIRQHIKDVAADISQGAQINKESLKYFSGMETLPKPACLFMKIVPVVNIGFNMMFRQKGIYDKRFNQPYL